MNHISIRDEIIEILKKSEKGSPYLHAVRNQIEQTNNTDDIAKFLLSALISVDTHLHKTTEELIAARMKSSHIPPVIIQGHMIESEK